MNSIAEVLFGPEYTGSVSEDLGQYDVTSNRYVNILYKGNNMVTSILPPGGYVIKYLRGYYLAFDGNGTQNIINHNGSGLKVRWCDSNVREWTDVDFPNINVTKGTLTINNIDDLFYLEFTTPHRLQLYATSIMGSVSIRGYRYRRML